MILLLKRKRTFGTSFPEHAPLFVKSVFNFHFSHSIWRTDSMRCIALLVSLQDWPPELTMSNIFQLIIEVPSRIVIHLGSWYSGLQWREFTVETTMSILDAYSEDFSTKCQEISNSISELKDCATTDRDKSSSIVRQIDGLISQADMSIKQMELEVRSQDLSTRKALTEKMSLYKKTLLSHRSDFERYWLLC